MVFFLNGSNILCLVIYCKKPYNYKGAKNPIIEAQKIKTCVDFGVAKSLGI